MNEGARAIPARADTTPARTLAMPARTSAMPTQSSAPTPLTGRRRWWLAGVPAALVLAIALTWPVLFTDATFNADWLNHLWYIWHQAQAIRADGVPSLFLDYSGGILYPLYAFYGGTVYALAGALALVLGDSPMAAYVLTFPLTVLAAYGGWLWMARELGVHGWAAHAPGLVFVTSASYLTMIYGLGDWPELLAVSAMPPMLAAGLRVLREERLRFGPALALAASSVVFFGSHLLTLIWGSTLLALTGVALFACVPKARRGVTRGGALRVLGIVLPALLLSAWFLLPSLAYEAQTAIAANYPHFRALLRASMYTVAARHLFTFSRAPDSGSVVTLALPVAAIGWVLAALAICLYTRRTGTWTRVLLTISAATLLVTLLMTHAAAILALPRPYATLQFSFRLESFVLLGVSGAMLAALVQAEDARGPLQRWRWMLVPVLAVALLGGLEQVARYSHGPSRSVALSSYGVPLYEGEGLLDYVDDRLPILRRPLPAVAFAPGSLDGTRTASVAQPRAGELVDTNLRSIPALVQVTGAEIVGTDAHADDVMRLDRARGADPHADANPRTDSDPRADAGPATISVTPAGSPLVVLGRALSALGALLLAVQLIRLGVTPAVRSYRRHF